MWQDDQPSPRAGKVSPKATDEVAQLYLHVHIPMGLEPWAHEILLLCLSLPKPCALKELLAQFLGPNSVSVTEKKEKTPKSVSFLFSGVRYGSRTHDLQGHNLAL